MKFPCPWPLVLVLLGSACDDGSDVDAGNGGTSSATQTADSDARATGDAGSPSSDDGNSLCEGPTSCEDFSLGDSMAGVATLAPEDFPAPPSGATLCGENQTARQIYYLWDGTRDELFAYYEAELTASGWTAGEIDTMAGGGDACDTAQSFTRSPELMVVYWYGSNGEMFTLQF